MSSIIQLKNTINKIYSQFAVYINPLLKFILALIVFFVINSKMGYMEKITGGSIVLLVALFCSFMPMAFMALLEGVFILMHFYALSMEMAIVAAAVLFMMFILFLRFTPKEGVVVLLMPIFFILKVPYLLPIIVGLVGTPVSVISIAFGVIVTYMINFATSSAEYLTSGADENMMNRIRYVVDGLIANKGMIAVIVAFSVVLVVVYFIRRLKLNFSWTIAVIIGSFVNLILMFIVWTAVQTDLSLVGILFGTVISLLLGLLVVFFIHNLDYRRVENHQFEDEEYFYYVKAVPKMGVNTSGKKRPASKPSSSSNGTRVVKTSNGAKRKL